MIIALYGPDTFRREEKKREIVREFVAKHPLAQVITIDVADETSRNQLREFGGTRSLFDPAAFIVLQNAYELGKKDVTEFLIPHLEAAGLVYLFSEDTKPPKPFEAIFKATDPKSKALISQEFEHLEGAAWKTFITKRAALLEVEFAPEALQFLAHTYEKDTWGLVTEMEKLSCLGKKVVGMEDIEGSDAPEAPNFFGMLSALKSPRAKDRLAMLAKLNALGEPAAKLFHILAYQGENPMRFAKYDFAVKSGKLEYEEALLDALL